MKPKLVGHYSKGPAPAPKAFSEWQSNPSDENYRTLYKELQPTVESAIQTHGGGDPSLRTRARIITMNALRTYDPSQGAALNTHVFNHLQRLNRIRAERYQAIHVPENMRTDRTRLERDKAEYRDLHGVEPSIAKLSDISGLSVKRIERALNSGEISAAQMEGDKGDLPAVRRSGDIWVDYVYHDLDERSKKIFEWTTGHNKSPMYTKTEIARRLGITPAAVSQRVARIAAQLEQGVSE